MANCDLYPLIAVLIIRSILVDFGDLFCRDFGLGGFTMYLRARLFCFVIPSLTDDSGNKVKFEIGSYFGLLTGFGRALLACKLLIDSQFLAFSAPLTTDFSSLFDDAGVWRLLPSEERRVSKGPIALYLELLCDARYEMLSSDFYFCTPLYLSGNERK